MAKVEEIASSLKETTPDTSSMHRAHKPMEIRLNGVTLAFTF